MSVGAQRESVETRIQALERKGSRVTRLSLLALVAVAAGGLVMLLAGPAAAALTSEASRIGSAALAAFVVALGVGLLSLWKQEAWRKAREKLVGELVRRDAMEKLLLLDPLTGVFNRRYLEEVLTREISRVERHDASLSFLKMRLENMDDLEAHEGGEIAELILKEVARTLYRNMRPTDVVMRYERNEFLVVMSETSKHGALVAVRRLLEQVDEINAANEGVLGYPIQLSYGLAGYFKGQDVRDVIAAAEHSIRLYRERGPVNGHAAGIATDPGRYAQVVVGKASREGEKA